MVVQVENSSKKSFGQTYCCTMPQFTINCSSSWNVHEHDSSERFSIHLSSKVGSPYNSSERFSIHLSSKVGSPSRHCLEVKHLGPPLQDQKSSSTQSNNQSQQEAAMMGKPNSQEQCVSSKTVQDESYIKHVQGQPSPGFACQHPDFYTNPSQLEMNQTSIYFPGAYAEPYFSGLFTAYGPSAAVQQQMVGIAPARVPLPVDLAEDGPIYVNAKQYHGILRRRQMRAKLEAQHKLVKTRKPYLHESRHLHALNRVRGSGGRFVGTKKAQQSEATPSTSSSSDSVNLSEKGKTLNVNELRLQAAKDDAPTDICYGITQKTNGVVNLEQMDYRFSSISTHMAVPLPGRGGGLECNGQQHGAPVVQ